MSGNAFQDLPFPVSGPILGAVGENSLDFTISRTR
ncbi:hypothetical protein FHR79_002183 [Micrococcus aloeverae]|uniref:Uncharacterized protein n=1 Tax=Micrococcus aloeverae TaxID=1391911 RepID=A0ABR6E0G6_9MICC|nr:hypothetical protein [Micrococcus aloeverae]